MASASQLPVTPQKSIWLWIPAEIRLMTDFIERIHAISFNGAYDSEALREQVRKKNGAPIIPRKKNSKTGNDDIDWDLYKCRHLVENVFAKLKHYRGIATRFDKLKRNFLGALTLVCAYFWLPL